MAVVGHIVFYLLSGFLHTEDVSFYSILNTSLGNPTLIGQQAAEIKQVVWPG